MDERIRLRRSFFLDLGRFPTLKGRWFDADPWTGNGTEFLVCEFSSLPIYWEFWNSLRQHSIFCKPYASISRVSLGYERSIKTGLVET